MEQVNDQEVDGNPGTSAGSMEKIQNDHRVEDVTEDANEPIETLENNDDDLEIEIVEEDPGARSTDADVDIDFPKSLLKRIVKEQVRVPGADGGEPDIQVNKDVTLAFNEAAKLFIHYLTCAANDICMEARRQTVGVEDVYKALAETEFEEFIDPLRESLNAFKASKKRKAPAVAEEEPQGQE